MQFGLSVVAMGCSTMTVLDGLGFEFEFGFGYWLLFGYWVLVLSLNCLTVVGDAIWLIGGGNGLLYGDSTGWFGF